MSDDKKCTYVNPKTKVRCKANHLKGESLCFAHSPTTKDKREIARAEGGMNHFKIQPVPTKFIHVEGVLSLLEETVGELRGMNPSVQKSRAIIGACETAIDILRVTDLERRIYELEQKAKDKDTDKSSRETL